MKISLYPSLCHPGLLNLRSIRRYPWDTTWIERYGTDSLDIPVILTDHWQNTSQDDVEWSWWDHLQIIGKVSKTQGFRNGCAGLPGGEKYDTSLSSQAILLISQMSIMYKINNTEVHRLATVFIGQPVEVHARFIDVVAFVGGQSMPGPEHARQSYWQALPERYDVSENKTEEILQTILTISLHTVLRNGIFRAPEGRRRT